ncbi:MAG TPA: alpha/beta fold hydrolase [Polyangium sp.]|nr:alpha/beta fold hydrolase [Polyangium sp.]
MRFKKVDPQVLRHDVERRGFLPVPLDWQNSKGPSLDLFYRLIPALGGSPDDRDKPVIVVINGGPGIAASFYRPLDYDYTTNSNPHGGLDRFKYLLKSFRVLIVDQRGTDGCSSPLDMDDPETDPADVARYFSSDSHALDYRAVINALIPDGDRFFVIAQSYGGMPGMQFVAHPGRRANGIVFSSSALPFEDPMESALGRRREQLRLNLHLRSVIPDIAERIERVQAHYKALKLEPSLFHGLFVLLGKDVPGVWERGVVARLDKILAQSREELLADIEAGQEAPNLLNYILSSVNFSPGYTDRTLAAQSSRAIPFEPWMIDENVMLMQTGQDGTWRQELINRFDAAPPPGTPMPSLEVLREAIGRNHLLFTAADNDAFVPADVYQKAVEKFLVPGHTELRTLPGGHSAIFLEKGYEAFLEWSRDK